jgi:hypothetical protein
MIEETYPYFPIGDELFWGFKSEGVKGIIPKVVLFTPIRNGKWNLGFGDWKNNDIDDKTMSNNQDVVKVIGTVAKVAIEFLEHYPDATLVIKPVDEKRKKLYNIVFQRHFETIKDKFKIIGINGKRRRIYSPEKVFDHFELSLKLK